LRLGNNFFQITFKLVDDSEFSVGANYPVRRMVDGARAFPAAMPESKLECHNNQSYAVANQSLHFNATGGNGTYSWSSPSDAIPAGEGVSFVTYFRNPGVYNVYVTSGNQQVACEVQVFLAPPQVAPLPVPTTPQPAQPPSTRP
jgi:hypothetical protein